MKNYMKNERGLTLIELLGAISLTAIIITVAIALFASVSGFTYSNSEGRSAQRNTKYALSQIAARLQDSDKIFRPTDTKEIRYSTFSRNTKAICYVQNPENGGEIWVFDYIGTWDAANISYSSNPTLYTNGHKIAANIVAAPIYQKKSATGLEPITNEFPKGTVHLSIEYTPKRKTATGGISVGSSRLLQTTVKLYEDGK